MSPLTIGEHSAVRAVVSQSRVAGRAALVAALDRIKHESPPIPGVPDAR